MLKGLQFMAYTSLLKNETLGIATTLDMPQGVGNAFVYEPKGKEKGLIITLTGFAMNGYRDKRIAVVNNAFTKMGYRVITPQIKTIDQLLIHPTAIDELKEAITSIVADPILNPLQLQPAIFAPSFTAGIAAIAVSELPPNTVSALCLLGTFSDFKTTIQFALTNPNNADDYGMHILLKNFLKYDITDDTHIIEIIDTALADNGLKRKPALLPGLLERTPAASRALYQKILSDVAYREELILRAWTNIPGFDQWQYRLDLAKHAHKISCKVALIHGAADAVIPAEQSVLLYNLLQANNPQVHLVLSNLLDHGDLKITFKIFSEVAQLARAFAFFINETPAPSH
jgi:pimeloyl-ACP methyl ester carboxylesterase